MFSRKIKFSCHEDYFDQKEDYPIPAVINIPEWYKKLEHSMEKMTVKGCMPFLDTLKIGYILKVPQDILIKHSDQPFHKILNPWNITTPAGYSCLFVPPLNNADDRFSILPGIVDTDQFNNPINFPIVLNGDKYPSQELFIKKGTPYVQIIPFKRDNWKMELVPVPEKQIKKNKLFYDLTLFNKYKNKFWKRKTCK